MDGLAGYGSEGSENSPNPPHKRIMNKHQKLSISNIPTLDGPKADGDGEQSGEQLEAEWASFQAMISAEKSLEQSNATQPSAEMAVLGDHSADLIMSEDMAAEEVKKKHSDSSSSSDSGSDKSGKSHSDSGSEDESSEDESADEKDEKDKKATADVAKDKSGSKSPDHTPAKKKQRRSSGSSESETEKKPAPSQSAGKHNGQSHAEPSDKDRRHSRSSPSPKRHRSRSHERRYKVWHRSRSHDRKRRRRPRRSRSKSRGRKSRSRDRKIRRKSRSHERDEKSDIRKPSDRRKSRSRSVTTRDKRRSRSRSPRRRRKPRSCSRGRRRRRSHSRSPHRGIRRRRKRRRRKRRRPSGRISRSWSRSRSPSPVLKKKRNEPLNYKEKLKQSFLQVQKQAAEGKLNLDDLATKGKDLVIGDKPNILPLMGKESPLATIAGSQLGVLTPQQVLLQTMAAMHQKNVAAMHQKAQELTGVVVPKYYNPASVNPLKYAEQFQKRKLLWGKKKAETKPCEEQAKTDLDPIEKPTTTKPKTQWDGALFSQDQGGKQAAKFRKLMGMKHGESIEDGEAESEAAEELDDTQLKKHEEMFTRLDQEYEFARMATHTHRGIGLGFTSMHHQYTK